MRHAAQVPHEPSCLSRATRLPGRRIHVAIAHPSGLRVGNGEDGASGIHVSHERRRCHRERQVTTRLLRGSPKPRLSMRPTSAFDARSNGISIRTVRSPSIRTCRAVRTPTFRSKHSRPGRKSVQATSGAERCARLAVRKANQALRAAAAAAPTATQNVATSWPFHSPNMPPERTPPSDHGTCVRAYLPVSEEHRRRANGPPQAV
jgi:hypothetical protein